jgi:hypothetical protein
VVVKILDTTLFRGNKCSSENCRIKMNHAEKSQAAKFPCGHIVHIGCLDNAYVSSTTTSRSLNFQCLRSNCNQTVTLDTIKQALPITESGKAAYKGMLLRILQEPIISQGVNEQNQRTQAIDSNAQLICWVELGNSLSLSTQDRDEERVTLTARGSEPTLINL